MKVVALGQLISAHTLSRAALASQTAHARTPPPDACVHPTNPCTLNIISLSLDFISAEPTPIIWWKRAPDWAQSVTTRVPAAICKAHDSAHNVNRRSEPPHFHLQLTFIVRGFPWAFPFLSFQIDFSFFFKQKGNCLLPLSANNPQWATEYPGLLVPIVGVLQILLSWPKQTYIKIRNLAYTCKKGHI